MHESAGRLRGWLVRRRIIRVSPGYSRGIAVVEEVLRNCTEECSPDPSLALFDDVFLLYRAFLFARG